MNLTVTQKLDDGLDGWVVPIFEGELEGAAAALDGSLDGALKEAIESKEFEARANSTFWLRPMGRLPVRRIVVVGLGKRSGAVQRIPRACAAGVRALKDIGCRRIGLMLPHDSDESVQSIAESLVTGTYEFRKYKSGDDAPKVVSDIFIEGPDALREAVERGRIVGEAANFCRDIANEPPIVATPEYVAQLARSLASDKIKVTVLDEQALARSGMNAILSVGQGSVHPPRIVGLEYRGAGADAPLYAIVGKGVTFDSGGLSLKPAASMEGMKFDKCGACAVIGVVKAVSDLGLKINLLGVAGLAENMPGSTAYRPGDIIKAGSGKTIEVLNTDAEGRVVLADALYFAGTHDPVEMLDLATLTGACVVALGDLCAGVLGNDDALISELIAVGEKTGERLWQLPLWPEYDEKVKSEVADLKNIGERSGGMGLAGAIAGASFLKAFVPEKCRWAHLDIAGVADGGKKAWRGAGATGFGVRLVVEWLRARAQN